MVWGSQKSRGERTQILNGVESCHLSRSKKNQGCGWPLYIQPLLSTFAAGGHTLPIRRVTRQEVVKEKN